MLSEVSLSPPQVHPLVTPPAALPEGETSEAAATAEPTLPPQSAQGVIGELELPRGTIFEVAQDLLQVSSSRGTPAILLRRKGMENQGHHRQTHRLRRILLDADL